MARATLARAAFSALWACQIALVAPRYSFWWSREGLPRKVTVDIAKCHACHAKRRGATASHLKPSAPPEPVQCHACHACHAKWRWMSAPPEPAQCHACHACHAKWRWMPLGATLATTKRRSATASHLKPSAPPEPAQCHACHACHAKWRWMSPSATPATQSDGGCRQVPRLPRKTPRRHGVTPKTKRATRASPMPCVPRLPRKVTVDVTKCHACHAKWRWMSPSATPATQNAAASHLKPSAAPEPAQCHACHACRSKWRWMSLGATPATQNAAAPRRHT